MKIPEGCTCKGACIAGRSAKWPAAAVGCAITQSAAATVPGLAFPCQHAGHSRWGCLQEAPVAGQPQSRWVRGMPAPVRSHNRHSSPAPQQDGQDWEGGGRPEGEKVKVKVKVGKSLHKLNFPVLTSSFRPLFDLPDAPSAAPPTKGGGGEKGGGGCGGRACSGRLKLHIQGCRACETAAAPAAGGVQDVMGLRGLYRVHMWPMACGSGSGSFSGSGSGSKWGSPLHCHLGSCASASARFNRRSSMPRPGMPRSVPDSGCLPRWLTWPWVGRMECAQPFAGSITVRGVT